MDWMSGDWRAVCNSCSAHFSLSHLRNLFETQEVGMLVLTRKQQEQIRIGNQVTITILRISGNQVRVGIEAPPDVRILRGELPAHAEQSPNSTIVETTI